MKYCYLLNNGIILESAVAGKPRNLSGIGHTLFFESCTLNIIGVKTPRKCTQFTIADNAHSIHGTWIEE